MRRKLLRLFFPRNGEFAVYLDAHPYGTGGEFRRDADRPALPDLSRASARPTTRRACGPSWRPLATSASACCRRLPASMLEAMGFPPDDPTLVALADRALTLADLPVPGAKRSRLAGGGDGPALHRSAGGTPVPSAAGRDQRAAPPPSPAPAPFPCPRSAQRRRPQPSPPGRPARPTWRRRAAESARPAPFRAAAGGVNPRQAGRHPGLATPTTPAGRHPARRRAAAPPAPATAGPRADALGARIDQL